MVRLIKHMLGGVFALAAMATANSAYATENAYVCGSETAKQERKMEIPDRLLHAISLMESGRWDAERRETIAWPWTVMAEGQGRFLPSKEAAVAEVRKLQARGVRNIDVGCMQVNLLAHPDAFANLDEAFEPATNVAYAARFLVGLYSSTKNWATAGAYYHSQTPSESAPYKAKLLATWNRSNERGDTRIQLASLTRSEDSRPPLGLFLPLPARDPEPAQPHVAPQRPAPVAAHPDEDRVEAKRIADAYRQAKLEEYRLRRQQMTKG